jgi:hypothetical protein
MTDKVKKSYSQFTALAVLCLIVGLLLTLDNIGILEGTWKLWPIFPLFLGLGGLFFFKSSDRKDLVPLGISIYFVLCSLFFFFLNFTTWSVMSDVWPTFIGIFGVTILITAYFAERKKWFALSGLFFVFLALVFFLVFAIEAKLWPLSLMLFGVWILLIPERSTGEKRSINS